TFNVNGNLVFGAGAFYHVEVSPSAADYTNVTGSMTLSGTVQAVFAPGSYLERAYIILSASGGIGSGRFTDLATTNLPAGFTAKLNYAMTDVVLMLTAVLAETNPADPAEPNAGSIPAGGFATNQKGVAATLNSYFNAGGKLPPNFVALFGLTGV